MKQHLIVFLFVFVSMTTTSQIKVIDVETKAPVSDAILFLDNHVYGKSNPLGFIHTDSTALEGAMIQHPGYLDFIFPQINTRQQILVELIPNMVQLNETVVSAGKTTQRKKDLTTSIGLIELGEMISRSQRNSAELLKSIPGVQVQDGTLTTNRITIRGIGSRTPYGTNRLKAFLGEIPLSNGEGVTALEDISPSSLGRIEIIKSSSPLYGSGTGGVLILHPFYPAKPGLSLTTNHYLGSFGLSNSELTVGYKKNKLSISSGLNAFHNDGYRENNITNKKNALITANWFGENNRLQLMLGYIDVYSEIPSSLSLSDFNNSPASAASNWLKVNGHEDYSKLYSGLTLVSSFTKSENKLTIYNTNNWHYESRPFNSIDEDSKILGVRENFNFYWKYISLSFGTDFMFENFQWDIYETNAGAQGNLNASYSERRYLSDTYINAIFKLNPRINLETGASVSKFAYLLFEHPNLSSSGFDDEYQSPIILSPKAGINYKINDCLQTRASYSEGYAAPSVEESLMPEGMVNLDLKPETSQSMEFGISFDYKNRFSSDLSVYHSIISNMLVNKRLSEDTFMAINAGKTTLSGIEISAKYWFLQTKNQNFHVQFSQTFTDNRFRDFSNDGIEYHGNQIPAIPQRTSHLKLFAGISKNVFLSSDLLHYGEQYLTDDNSITYGSFSVLNLDISYKLYLSKTIQVRVFGTIKNALNQHYSSMILPNAKSFGGAAPRYFYPGLPRHYSAGVSFSFKSGN